MNRSLYPFDSNRHLNRRSFLFAASSLAAAAAFAGCASGPVKRRGYFSAYPFQLGVASGDPDHRSVVLWTRLAPEPLTGGGMRDDSVIVTWEVAEDQAMTKVVKKGRTIARPEWAHSVHVEVGGLRPDRWYWYRFEADGELSPLGRTRTMPEPKSMPGNFKFAFASCQHWEAGYFSAYDQMLRDAPDIVFHLGDYIYEGGGRANQVRRHVGPELMTLEHYRNRHAQYKTDPSLQAMHAAAPWAVTWDDHEVDNNYAGAISERAKVSREELLLRRAAAYQAYYEHMPLRRSSIPKGPDMQIFRKVSVGRLAEFLVLDTRQYRSDQPCGDTNGPQCPEALDPKATLLGEKQREWMFKALDKSSSRWNVLAQQVMMARVDRVPDEAIGYSMDQWPGYEMERRRVLNFFREQKISNPVVLTGDIHTHWANELIADFDELDSTVVGSEFVATSISSGGDGVEKTRNHDKLMAENPFVKFQTAQRGYVLCHLSPNEWRSDFKVTDFVTRPGGTTTTRESFVLENGQPGLKKA